MPSRFPNPQSGIVVLILLYAGSAAALAFGALAAPADEARSASARMARHKALAPMAAELDELARLAGALAASPTTAAKSDTSAPLHGAHLGLEVIFAMQKRLDALEMRMLRASAKLDAQGRADLVAGIVALHALRGGAAAAEKELLILITPTIVTPTAEAASEYGITLSVRPRIIEPSRALVPDGGTVLIGGLRAR